MDSESSDQTGPVQLLITSPSTSSSIATPDVTVNVTGTAGGDNPIESVIWKNDRGGTGQANGKEKWTTGNIVLQLGTNTITITATDNTGEINSKSLVVERESSASASAGTGNRAPKIGGTPASTITSGLSYFFLPTSSDPDGDALSFSISNKPGWLNFNSSTGRLIGTPNANNIGSYKNIVIRVSDGKATTSLSAFSINVVPTALGSATVNWIAPTERIDNTPLTNLAAFRLSYGQASRTYGNAIYLNNPGLASYVVENLSPGSWYFSITAIDANGSESGPSNEIERSIP
jgi:putative Ig domain-containing protein